MIEAKRITYARLSERDNVVILVRHVEQGEAIEGLDGQVWRMGQPLEPGNKLAARAIATDEPIVKYACPIGIATEPIAPGAHVHLHNMRSSYIAFETGEAFRG